MIMKISKLLFGAVILLIVSSCKKDDPNPSIEGYTLEWSDEFNGSSISTVNWCMKSEMEQIMDFLLDGE